MEEEIVAYHAGMAILLDDQPMMWVGRNLGELLQAAQKRLEGTGRMIVQVEVNGASLVGAEISQRHADDVAQAEVRLISANPADLALDTLGQLREVLTQAGDHLRTAGESFQIGQGAEGMRNLGQAMDIWHQLPQAVIQSAALMDIDLDTLTPPGQTMISIANHLAEQLRSLRDSLQSGDTVALGDALGYEWPGIIKTWDDLLAAMVDRIQTPPAPGAAEKKS